MIFVFNTPVEIAKRRAVLSAKSDTFELSHGVMSITVGDVVVHVPLSNIRYWRAEATNDHQKQAGDG